MGKSNLLTYGRKLHDIGRTFVEAVYAAGGNDEDAERIFNKTMGQQIGLLVMGKLPFHLIIDLAAAPFVPTGWTVEEHRGGGQFEWDPKKVKFYLSERQKNGGVVKSDKLRKELANQPVLNANVLDYLLIHPKLIPESLKNKRLFFWGTIYRRRLDGALAVRYLYCGDDGWNWRYHWLATDSLNHNDLAALKAA